MTETVRKRINPVNLLIGATLVAVLLLSSAATYSAYVSSSAHHNNCQSRKQVASLFHDLIILAFTPQPGQTLTATQVTQIQAFEAQAFPRIDEILC